MEASLPAKQRVTALEVLVEQLHEGKPIQGLRIIQEAFGNPHAPKGARGAQQPLTGQRSPCMHRVRRTLFRELHGVLENLDEARGRILRIYRPNVHDETLSLI